MRTVGIVSACLTFLTASCTEERPSRAFAEMLLAFNGAPQHYRGTGVARASTPQAAVTEAFAMRVQEDLARAGLKKTLAEVTEYLEEIKQEEQEEMFKTGFLGGIRDSNEEQLVQKAEREKQKPKEVRGRIIKTGTMKDTVIVKVDRRFPEKKQKTGKTQRRSNRVKVHAPDEEFAAGPHKIGDIVKIRQSIPISKEKKWKLIMEE
mmetsp:Transcript_52196/g.82898  ORF Transcript_52196/g.82898 Transcript_52196/m.82898 type:complete len:206 (-) Transcript_52196:87-704(-)